jgi:hypothetical protein
VNLRVALINSHALVPIIGDLSEAWIKRSAKTIDQIGQWIFEVTIFAFAKAMSPHVNVASKANFVVVKPSNLAAFFW